MTWTPTIKKTVLEKVTIMSESEAWDPSLPVVAGSVSPGCSSHRDKQ